MTVGDINSDGNPDLIAGTTGSTFEVFLNNSDGTFKSRITSSSGNIATNLAVADINRDGVLDVVSNQSTDFFIGYNSTTLGTTMERLNILSQSSARSALSIIDSTRQRILLELGSLGAVQSGFSSTLNTVSASKENMLTAQSRIMDIDVASEAADSVRSQILAQAATAVLAQANQSPAIALKLLGR